MRLSSIFIKNQLEKEGNKRDANKFHFLELLFVNSNKKNQYSSPLFKEELKYLGLYFLLTIIMDFMGKYVLDSIKILFAMISVIAFIYIFRKLYIGLINNIKKAKNEIITLHTILSKNSQDYLLAIKWIFIITSCCAILISGLLGFLGSGEDIIKIFIISFFEIISVLSLKVFFTYDTSIGLQDINSVVFAIILVIFL